MSPCELLAQRMFVCMNPPWAQRGLQTGVGGGGGGGGGQETWRATLCASRPVAQHPEELSCSRQAAKVNRWGTSAGTRPGPLVLKLQGINHILLNSVRQLSLCTAFVCSVTHVIWPFETTWISLSYETHLTTFFHFFLKVFSPDYFRKQSFLETFPLFHVFFPPLLFFLLPQCGQHVSGSLQRTAHLQLT